VTGLAQAGAELKRLYFCVGALLLVLRNAEFAAHSCFGTASGLILVDDSLAR